MPCKLLIVSANNHKEPYPVYPLGVSYLKTYLKNHLEDCHVEIFDCNLGTAVDLAERIKTFEPKYIALSLRNIDGANSLVYQGFVGYYTQLVAVIREAAPSARLILGGSGFSIFPVELMQILGADFGIRGEGEEPLRQLIVAIETGGDTAHIEAVVTPESTQSAPPKRKYLTSLEVEFEPTLVEYYWKHSGMLNIQTKRGCPYDCIYCSYPVIDGHRVRTMDVDLIVDNILKLKRDYGVNYLFFTDSVFNISKSYNLLLAERLASSGANISWGAYFSPSNITDEEMRLYRASGLTHIEFGTESFSDECLAAYGKRFTFSDVLQTSELALKHNVYYSHFLILGGHGETPRTLGETIDNSRVLRHTVLFPYVGMRIYPHTRLREIALAEGIISPSDTLMEPTYYTAPGFDLEQTRKMALETGKAWIFPDDPQNELMEEMRIKRNKKGPIWEYLRKP